MTFKAKLFKLGNSKAVYIPKEVYTDLEDGKVYTFEVKTELPNSSREAPVYTKPLERTDKPFNTK